MTETLLDVEGMTCGGCVRHVSQALNTVEGVAEVDVSLRQGRVLVKHGATVATDALQRALAEAGYPARPTR
jgi:copper chaperone